MTYDFTTLLDRQGMDAVAWDAEGAIGSGMLGVRDVQVRDGFSIIPMWVADMNFPALPAIPEALVGRALHGAYGYFFPQDNYYNAIIRWHETRNNTQGLTKDCIGYENGVLGGLVSAIQAMAAPGDKVLVHAPTYIGFTHALEDIGYHIVLSPLVKDENGVWRMDYADMEQHLRDEHIHAAVFCSPHNPTGRVWEAWELEQAMDLYQKYDCYVVSDEIWSDLTLFDHKHIPTQMVSEDARMRTVALYAPSKTFNLAGLIGSYHVIYNPLLRDRVRAIGAKTCYNHQNVLSMHALLAAYSDDGQEWVNELRTLLGKNVNYAVDFIRTHFAGVDVIKPEGTYMLFLNCSAWCASHATTIDELEKLGISYGVLWQDGRAFHGENCIRMNLALPYDKVVEAFERLRTYVFVD